MRLYVFAFDIPLYSVTLKLWVPRAVAALRNGSWLDALFDRTTSIIVCPVC